MNKNVITVLDGVAGSSGKAKVIGEIATDITINLRASVTNCMTNAGHTFVDERGKKLVFRNIPVASVNPQTDLFIGSGSAIDMPVFKEEYRLIEPYLGDRKIYVHELVPLIEERHKEYERENIKTGSTYKGCGAVSIEKIMRDPNLKFFQTYKNAIRCTNDEWFDRLYAHLDNPEEYVLLEGAQGCGLSLNHSGNYPYVTSRNVSISRLLDDTGISPSRHLENIMTIRPFPIRISNISEKGALCYTGSFGEGQELTWTQINLASKFGIPPFKNDIDFYDHHLTRKIVEELLDVSSETTLKQVFGDNYQHINASEVTVLEALEMERLFYKENNTPRYISRILKFSDNVSPYIEDLSENTTVTQKERRIFNMDIDKLKRYLQLNDSYGIYLNFFQQLSIDYYHKSCTYEEADIERNIKEYLYWIESSTNTEIIQLGTGARNNERIIKKSLILR
ncbi:MAG: adenylosuccinate synthetase [Bacilli bacterium]|nr:adenylosuccinate synthetase [Bacilli bacterium]